MGTAYVVSRLPEQEIGSLGSTAVVPNLMGTAWATLEGLSTSITLSAGV